MKVIEIEVEDVGGKIDAKVNHSELTGEELATAWLIFTRCVATSGIGTNVTELAQFVLDQSPEGTGQTQ